MKPKMKSILGIGNALTDILAVLPDDSFLKLYHLPKGSMQFVDMETGNKIFESLKPYGLHYVAGGSAANTITCTAIFGMPSAFIGKVGEDELGHLFKSDEEQYGVKTMLLKGKNLRAGQWFSCPGPMLKGHSRTTWEPLWKWFRKT